jgi:adenylate cyclase
VEKPASTPTNPDGTPAPGAAEVRRLSVIMFTDMVGYSSLTQRNEALALELLDEHCRIVRPILARHGGREIKTIGDAFLVEFSSALAAARCAVEIQQAHHARNAITATGRQIQIRIGLHAGDVVCRGNDVFGDGVNIAARIEPLAEAGGICVSEDVARQVQNKLGCPLMRLGAGELKNITLSVNIYRVVLPWQKQRTASAERLTFFFKKKSTRRILAALVLVLLAVGAVLFRRPADAGMAAPTNRLAVLPLVNFSGESRDEYFADGMTEELISSLSALRELDVIARTSIVKFKNTHLDIAEIGRALNVGSILEGTVRVAGDDARVNITLVDVRTQKTLWSEEFTRKMKDVFAIQSAIATSVTEALKIQLLAGEHDLLEHRGTDNNAAYREYLLGKSHLNQRTGDELVKAIESFQRAVDQDSSFALAYTGLAEAYTLVGNAGYASLPREDAISRARASAAKAIALDDSLAEAHFALGYVKFRIDWDWAGAEKEFQRALQLKPGYARVHEVYALYLAIQLRLNEAMVEMQRARQLDPLSASVSNGLGRILHFQRKFPEAIEQFKQTLKLDPNYAEAQFSMGMSYLADARYDEAIAALQEAIRMSNQRQVMISMLGLAEGRAGKTDAARKILAEMQQSTEASPSAINNAGLVHLGLGESDAALQAFAEAVAAKEGTMIYSNVDPVTNVLRPDPRFQALVLKMGLPVFPPATP